MVRKSRISQYQSLVSFSDIYMYMIARLALWPKEKLKQVLVDATISMAFTIFSFSFFVFSLTSQRPNKEKDIVVDFIKTNI